MAYLFLILGAVCLLISLKHQRFNAILQVASFIFGTLAGGLYVKSTEMIEGNIVPFLLNQEKLLTVMVGSNSFDIEIEKKGANQFQSRRIDLSRMGLELREPTKGGRFEFPVWFMFESGKILVNAEMKDKAGKTVFFMVNNNLKVVPDAGYDRNYDSTAIEVINKQKIPVLQVFNTQENVVYVGGLFDFGTDRVFVYPQGMTPTPSEDQIKQKSKRIFVYPGDKNLGRREPPFEAPDPNRAGIPGMNVPR